MEQIGQNFCAFASRSVVETTDLFTFASVNILRSIDVAACGMRRFLLLLAGGNPSSIQAVKLFHVVFARES